MSPASAQAPAANDARTAALDAADTLFYEHGVSGVRIADVRDASGVSMRRLYSMFPAKSDLVAGWLAYRHNTWMAMFEAGIDRRLAEGEKPIDAVFGSIETWMVDTNFRGCGFINTLGEGRVTDQQRDAISNHKQTLTDSLDRFTDDPRALAVIIDGAIVQAAIFTSTEPVDAAKRVATSLFNRPTDPPRKD